MDLDWDSRVNLQDHNILLHKKTTDTTARVTIGLPTFRRGHLIRRALASIAAQSYRDFVLVISDNAGQDPETMAAVREFSADLPSVVLIAQKENIGAINNLKFLLAAAETEYFMWLADDDEISSAYLHELITLLEDTPKAPAAMGLWKMMQNPNEGVLREPSRHGRNSLLLRALRYVAGPTDDALFYGLHRTENLRCCRFDDYVWPNRGILSDFCYAFLFDLILQGPICYSHSACWICHNYSVKKYKVATAQSVNDRLKTLLRKINIHYLYNTKAFQKAVWLLPPIMLASTYGILREIADAVWRISLRNIRVREGMS